MILLLYQHPEKIATHFFSLYNGESEQINNFFARVSAKAARNILQV